MRRRTLLWALGLCALLLAGTAEARRFGKGAVLSHEFPPVRPQTLPAFAVPDAGQLYRGTLDDPWQYVQTIYDADTIYPSYPSYLNALPVQLVFSASGTGYLATLHTVFASTDRGRTWHNLDPQPPPRPQHSDWASLRSPMYISGMSARPVMRTSALLDTVMLSAYSSTMDTANLRLIYNVGGLRLYPFIQLRTPVWMTGVVMPDSLNAIALCGMDGRMWRNDSLVWSFNWSEVNPDKSFLRIGRGDTLMPADTWVGSCTGTGSLVIAVGSHQWVSEDGGQFWRIRPASDGQYDYAVSFCDTLNGLTGAGALAPLPRGWVHTTTDAGRHWSGRALQTDMPIRAVKMVTPLIGFAGGGDYEHGAGGLWRTNDGGQTWTRELDIGAEIRAMDAVRVSRAYVDVFAAGVFPDFRGGVWRTSLYLPDTTGALLEAEPDTLDFGVVAIGHPDTLTVTLHNRGAAADTILGVTGGGAGFTPVWVQGITAPVPPGTDMPVQVVFSSNVAGEASRVLTVQNTGTGLLEIYCRANAALGADAATPLLPAKTALTVWPNPGNASFEIRYELAREAEVALKIYDLSGRLVETLAHAQAAPGEHVQTWNAARYSSGIYFVRLEAAQGVMTRKLLLN